MLTNLDEFKHTNAIHEIHNQEKDKNKDKSSKEKELGISESYSASQMIALKQKNELALLGEVRDPKFPS